MLVEVGAVITWCIYPCNVYYNSALYVGYPDVLAPIPLSSAEAPAGYTYKNSNIKKIVPNSSPLPPSVDEYLRQTARRNLFLKGPTKMRG